MGEPIFATARGCVHRCRCCEQLQVHFGNALLSLDRDDFERLRVMVADVDAGFAQPPHAAADSASTGDADSAAAASALSYRAVLHAGQSGAAYSFTRDDVTELRALLEGSRFLLGLEQGGLGPSM